MFGVKKSFLLVQKRHKDPEINLMMDNDYNKLWKSGNVLMKVEGEVEVSV